MSRKGCNIFSEEWGRSKAKRQELCLSPDEQPLTVPENDRSGRMRYVQVGVGDGNLTQDEIDQMAELHRQTQNRIVINWCVQFDASKFTSYDTNWEADRSIEALTLGTRDPLQFRAHLNDEFAISLFLNGVFGQTFLEWLCRLGFTGVQLNCDSPKAHQWLHEQFANCHSAGERAQVLNGLCDSLCDVMCRFRGLKFIIPMPKDDRLLGALNLLIMQRKLPNVSVLFRSASQSRGCQRFWPFAKSQIQKDIQHIKYEYRSWFEHDRILLYGGGVRLKSIRGDLLQMNEVVGNETDFYLDFVKELPSFDYRRVRDLVDMATTLPRGPRRAIYKLRLIPAIVLSLFRGMFFLLFWWVMAMISIPLSFLILLTPLVVIGVSTFMLFYKVYLFCTQGRDLTLQIDLSFLSWLMNPQIELKYKLSLFRTLNTLLYIVDLLAQVFPMWVGLLKTANNQYVKGQNKLASEVEKLGSERSSQGFGDQVRAVGMNKIKQFETQSPDNWAAKFPAPLPTSAPPSLIGQRGPTLLTSPVQLRWSLPVASDIGGDTLGATVGTLRSPGAPPVNSVALTVRGNGTAP